LISLLCQSGMSSEGDNTNSCNHSEASIVVTGHGRDSAAGQCSHQAPPNGSLAFLVAECRGLLCSACHNRSMPSAVACVCLLVGGGQHARLLSCMACWTATFLPCGVCSRQG
jgi:hypothetical protein